MVLDSITEENKLKSCLLYCVSPSSIVSSKHLEGFSEPFANL